MLWCVESYKNAILWGIIAEINPITELNEEIFLQYGINKEEYSQIKSEIIMQHYFCGISPKETESYIDDLLEEDNQVSNLLLEEMEYQYGIAFPELPKEIKEKFYQDKGRYCGKGDFVHMCATMATILNDSKMKEIGNFAGVYNLVFDVDKNAGYAGDVYGTNGAGPSIGNEDYRADLDAVNIANRISEKKTWLMAFSEYYLELQEDTNRATEFLENMGDGDAEIGKINILNEANTYSEAISGSNLEIEDIEQRKAIVKRFVLSLVYGKNDMIQEEME